MTKAVESAIDENNERSNGNGSLMRILPVAFVCYEHSSDGKSRYELVRNVSSFTHAHENQLMIGIHRNMKHGSRLGKWRVAPASARQFLGARDGTSYFRYAKIFPQGVASKYPKQVLDIHSAPTAFEPYGFFVPSASHYPFEIKAVEVVFSRAEVRLLIKRGTKNAASAAFNSNSGARDGT